MHKIRIYHPDDLMSDLICDNYPMLLVMSRFGIDLGFGERSIKMVCEQSGVDLYTFLIVVNTLIADKKKIIKIDYSKLSLRALVTYRHNSHSYFLDYRLKSIREKLIETIDSKEDAAVVIVNYYDEYVSEVHRHMMHEESVLFPYIESVIEGRTDENYSIEVYSRNHDKIETKLSEFKNIIIKYYPAKSTNELNSVLFDIFSCEADLASHNEIENYILVPATKAFEAATK